MSHATEDRPVSYKAEVIADTSGQWAGNALRFASEDEAQCYVADLFARWTLVRDTRVVPSEDATNAAWCDGRVRYQPNQD